MASSTVAERGEFQKTVLFLSQLLSNTYILYVKTQNFHWNIRDERFYSLHKMFEKQYEELAEATDDLAERIRALGHTAPGALREFLANGSLHESESTLSGDAMLQQLIEDHHTLTDQIRPKISEIQKTGDEGTADLLIERLRYHEKTLWMLRSHFTR